MLPKYKLASSNPLRIGAFKRLFRNVMNESINKLQCWQQRIYLITNILSAQYFFLDRAFEKKRKNKIILFQV